MMKIVAQACIVIALLSCADRAREGQVVKVIDGDTFDLKSGNEKVRIRMFGIDSPERGQAFNIKAKEFTAALIAGKDVRVVIQNKDQYGRTVGDVYLPDGTHVNAALVKAGYAWHYKRYSNSPELANLENDAHRAGLGLWHDEHPVPPWEFRKGRR